MFKFIGKVINFITYIILMLTGILLLVGFLVLALAFVFGAQAMTDWINTILEQIFTGIGATGEVWAIPEWLSYVIAIPFLIFSLLGLAIILLTQRTARLGRHVNKAAKKVTAAEKIQESDFGSMTKTELMELLDENEIDYKGNWTKAKLVEVAEKKI